MDDVIEERGDLRVRLEYDQDARPYGDCYGLVFQVESSARVDLLHGEPRAGFDVDDALRNALDRYGLDWQMVERYLRIFHDVVSMDRSDPHRSGPTLVELVTRARAVDVFGIAPDREDLLRKAANLHDWTAWAQGEAYIWVLEERVTWVEADGSGRTLETWEQLDALGGLFGREYAEDDARTNFAAEVAARAA